MSRDALAFVRDGSRTAFVIALKTQLKGRDGTGTDTETLDEAFADSSALPDISDDMVFTADGGLRVTFNPGAIAGTAAGSYVVPLPKETAAPRLSAFGKRARQQTVGPSGTVDLRSAVTPTPSAPTHTASGDGLATACTATLLTYLAQYNPRATFFTVGQNVAAHPELVRAEAHTGNEVGNHSWNHPISPVSGPSRSPTS